ncbi:probable WRKY transcription factor 4 isoform X4 [Oryza glaberrima]|uniref:probable WRKY transcription factor 4 isoform X4 n=1 Tax=Oryza glaberrima TaxID=4538 RepID=UPI00224BF3BD|nr:probable WRKY transcription factor 4 isoform X4 [Oryza glaberrima]
MNRHVVAISCRRLLQSSEFLATINRFLDSYLSLLIHRILHQDSNSIHFRLHSLQQIPNMTSIEMEMDNQSGQPQYGMADHGFRPFSASISAPSTAQQHTGSSSNTAVIQVATPPSHTDYGNIYLADDGYHWRMCGQNTIQGEPCQTIFYYQCAQANCMVQKLVARSADGQTTQTFSMGVHNHPQRSVRWLRDGSERLEPMSQVGVLVGGVLVGASDAAGATVGPSVPETGHGNDQTSGSSDSDEDNDSDVGIDGDAAAAASADANALQSSNRREYCTNCK